MRLLSDMIDQLSSTVRLIAGLVTLCVMDFGAMMTFGVSVVAPQVAEDFAERAENVGEKAIAARIEAERAQALARDGWGYDAGTGLDAAQGFGPDPDFAQRPRAGQEEIGGWGD
ncbi:hypothetical protein [Erythrobacter sp. HL-111]|uniref:hypothetical protein n=1 Tax=Erythrobacter sp. HL-111 TaxID=1798193 RepID=UPI0006D9ED25|nr:hypothetical protein [Erythrobacter sp. HL-111]KPP88590.1 MAG: Coatomer (COPI) alpha subunit C-terminus [Erythrobacteraceae bacterium HL-111]SDS30453.1 hypothetical protein SAMN04515621_1325 [Erythrobacter sp. HL-111]